MDTTTLDALRLAYKQAIDEWIHTIHAEENLATSDHSVIAWEHWDTAGFAEEDARAKAKTARDAYKAGLREANIGI
jgi:predicted RNase H-like HicB family nuclease